MHADSFHWESADTRYVFRFDFVPISLVGLSALICEIRGEVF